MVRELAAIVVGGMVMQGGCSALAPLLNQPWRGPNSVRLCGGNGADSRGRLMLLCLRLCGGGEREGELAASSRGGELEEADQRGKERRSKKQFPAISQDGKSTIIWSVRLMTA